MKDMILLAIIVIVGILSGIGLIVGQTDLSIAGISGLLGFLAKDTLTSKEMA